MSGTLPSGLPRVVGDEEDLARFSFSSDDVRPSDLRVKAQAFMPNFKDGATSVSRHGPTPKAALWALAPRREGRTLYGAAIVKAAVVRQNSLDIHADDTPPRHANIVGWPSDEANPQMRKALCKELATAIADASTFIPFDPTP